MRLFTSVGACQLLTFPTHTNNLLVGLDFSIKGKVKLCCLLETKLQFQEQLNGTSMLRMAWDLTLISTNRSAMLCLAVLDHPKWMRIPRKNLRQPANWPPFVVSESLQDTTSDFLRSEDTPTSELHRTCRVAPHGLEAFRLELEASVAGQTWAMRCIGRCSGRSDGSDYQQE